MAQAVEGKADKLCKVTKIQVPRLESRKRCKLCKVPKIQVPRLEKNQVPRPIREILI